MDLYNNKFFKAVSPTFYLTSGDPAYQYQTQKIIQKTVGVNSSLYADNLSALNIYQYPTPSQKVNWNQMSDRRFPHYQPNCGYSNGSTYHGSSTRHTQTALRPGATNPGGWGVDIKHNSYYRYLGKLKGQKPFRRGVVPYDYGKPILYNPANPIHGAKTLKTNIVNGCNICNVYCPEYTFENNKKVYQIYDIENKMKTTEVVNKEITDKTCNNDSITCSTYGNYQYNMDSSPLFIQNGNHYME
jgi:Pyruvate/2-oxoacid:ferredoxin oxidoreductase delta subunit